MKRFHIHVGVKNLEHSIHFYSTLFGVQPHKTKSDYAKWMLEDPRVSFAISTRVPEGVDHLGLQVEDENSLEAITQRLQEAQLQTYGEGKTTCCYAQSQKAWVKDPSGMAWETYLTTSDSDEFGESTPQKSSQTACCAPKEATQTKCC